MRVLVSKDELAKFRRRARRAYPKEIIELLWGKQISPDEFHVHIFDQVKYKATNSKCETDEDDHNISDDEAQAAGLIILGSIHSHPGIIEEAAPSEADFDDGLRQGEIISGIIAIWQDRKTQRIKTRVKFWGPLVGVEAEFL